MKKNYLQLAIIVLLVFFIGLFIGTQLNDTGRYQMKDYSDGLQIFDTKTGVYYFKKTNYNGSESYIRGDIKNAKREEYKSKKTKK